MPASFTQDGRLGKLHTRNGLSDLFLLRFNGSDALNHLFEYRVEAISEDYDYNFDGLLGTPVTVEIGLQRGGFSHFCGLVTRAVWLGGEENGIRYDLEVRPWLALAVRQRNQRIFHEMTAPQIIEQVLGRYASGEGCAMTSRLSRLYPVLEYTVQYRESDFDFVSRLMERFGINYHFEHVEQRHTLVLTDASVQFESVDGLERPYRAFRGHHHSEEEHFWQLQPERNLVPGAVRHSEYNFKNPRADMEVERQNAGEHAFGDLEVYDYPGDYLTQQEGSERVAPLRMEQERTQDARILAEGDVGSMKSGYRVAIDGEHLTAAMRAPQICVASSHSYTSNAYGTGGQRGDGYSYSGRYTLQPEPLPIVPVRKTPLPIVHGPQTGTVVGEGEIDCDEYGRILVHFPWDIAGAISMRCRVSQNWAGQRWGGMIIPRVGMEVVVEFLEGDPDKPLVTGCVYNDRNMPPYDLPADKTKSVFKTDTHEGRGYNELTFEDKRQNELIYMHAEKDLEVQVLNDRTMRVTHDDATIVDNDATATVGQNNTLSVGANRVVTIGSDQSFTIGANDFATIGQNETTTIGANQTVSIGSNRSAAVAGTDSVDVAGEREVTVGGALNTSVAGGIESQTTTHTIMASNKLSLIGPGGKIEISASGITIQAPTITLKGMTNMQAPGMGQASALQAGSVEDLPLVEECDPEDS